MTLGEMSQFSAYVSMIYGPLRWIAALPRRIVQFMTSTAKVFEIIDEKMCIRDRYRASENVQYRARCLPTAGNYRVCRAEKLHRGHGTGKLFPHLRCV